jgi:hypothetical protein
MLSKDTIFKSFLPPAITTLNGITYVVPGWHIVPEGTTLEEVNKHWVKDELTGKSTIIPDHDISETVISQRTGEKYTVEFSSSYWSCTCMGFGFRGHCKHIDKVKQKHINK